MRRLILMRHAKSDWSLGQQDHERPLNKRGQTSAIAIGHWLKANNFLPGQVLCSSSQRTGETLMRLALPRTTPVAFSKDLYLADAKEMRAVLGGADARCVLMIGHNPGIADLAERLSATQPKDLRFFDYPTGATLVLDFNAMVWNDIGWHDGQPIDFMVPRDLT